MNPPSGAESPRPSPAFLTLAVIQRLLLEAGNAGTRRELIFHILNRSVEIARYDRAVLWDLRRKRPVLMGVSGTSAADGHSALVGRWRELVEGIPERDKPRILSVASGEGEKRFEQSVLWLPLRTRGECHAGLWLERWSAPAWSENDAKILAPLVTGYGNAFRPFFPEGRLARFARRRATWAAAVAALAAFAVLFFARAPLRIVAVCEVVPNRPYLVNAPIDGVIEEVLVRPGQEVGEGDELFVYAGEAAAEEYNVAWQQADMVRSDLARARAQALGDRAARAQVRILESRVRQEEARLEAAEFRLGRLRVRAGRPGVALVGEQAEWRGRPVATGEAIMMLVDPGDSKVRIWLPQDDRIDFDPAQPVSIMLNAESGGSRLADLEYVAAHAQPGPEGVYGFMAEARWRDGSEGVNIGMRGIAVVYGERVRLGYWLFRKPLASVRRFLGI